MKKFDVQGWTGDGKVGKGSNPGVFVSQKSPKYEEQKVQVQIAVIRRFMFRSMHQVKNVASGGSGTSGFIVHFKVVLQTSR